MVHYVTAGYAETGNKMTRVHLMLTPTQLKESLLRDLRSTGYALKEIIEVKVYHDGSVDLICNMNDPLPEED